MRELTKKEKKIARDIIEKGVQAEFKAGLENASKVIEEWKNKKLDNREAYHKLFKTVKDQDKLIAKRYDGMTGSRYLVTVAVILYEGQITEEDIKDFSEETKAVIKRWVTLWREE